MHRSASTTGATSRTRARARARTHTRTVQQVRLVVHLHHGTEAVVGHTKLAQSPHLPTNECGVCVCVCVCVRVRG